MNKLSSTEKINKNYYNNIYSSSFGSLFNLVKTLTSYDQQSKSKLNLHIIKKYFDLSKKMSVLDYGFGRGAFLLKMPKNSNLMGCEISENAVKNFPQMAKIIGQNVITFLPEELDSKINDNSVDIIICSHVLEHVSNDIEIFNLLKRKVKPCGYILINIPINEIWHDPKHVRKYTFEKFQVLSRNIGFHILESLETNQLDNFIMTHEILKKKTIIKKIMFKTIRLFLAILPLRVIFSLNNKLSKNYLPAQLICVLQK